jgi:hypothetical protein
VSAPAPAEGGRGRRSADPEGRRGTAAPSGEGRRERRVDRRRLRPPPVQYLLAAACLVSALVLAASEFMTTFEFTPPGGEPLQASEAADRHGYALVILAAFAIAGLAAASLSGSKPAATGVAVAGGIALLIFLLVDLPDAGQIGTLDDPRQSFIDAEAVPQAGFWFELLGSLSLAVVGTAYATLRPDQLVLFKREGRGREPQADESASTAEEPATTGPNVEPLRARAGGRERRATRTSPRRRERG